MDLYTRKFEVISDSLRKLSEIKRENKTFREYQGSWKNKDIVERNIQKMVEAIIDMGKMLIADRKLHEPGNNKEVFKILSEAGLFPLEYISLIDKIIGMRNIIVHSYDKIEDTIMYGVLKKNLKDIKKITLFFQGIISEVIKKREKGE